ncbi:MAG: helix-turn-helix domain-containing protein [Rectinemataceae bacterium]
MDNPLRTALARNLKLGRKALGLSQAALAEKADISAGFVGEIEIGNKFPTDDTLLKLAEALGLPVYRLLMTESEILSEADYVGKELALAYAARMQDRIQMGVREMVAGPWDPL